MTTSMTRPSRKRKQSSTVNGTKFADSPLERLNIAIMTEKDINIEGEETLDEAPVEETAKEAADEEVKSEEVKNEEAEAAEEEKDPFSTKWQSLRTTASAP